jgi:hypothetical protein
MSLITIVRIDFLNRKQTRDFKDDKCLGASVMSTTLFHQIQHLLLIRETCYKFINKSFDLTPLLTSAEPSFAHPLLFGIDTPLLDDASRHLTALSTVLGHHIIDITQLILDSETSLNQIHLNAREKLQNIYRESIPPALELASPAESLMTESHSFGEDPVKIENDDLRYHDESRRDPNCPGYDDAENDEDDREAYQDPDFDEAFLMSLKSSKKEIKLTKSKKKGRKSFRLEDSDTKKRPNHPSHVVNHLKDWLQKNSKHPVS